MDEFNDNYPSHSNILDSFYLTNKLPQYEKYENLKIGEHTYGAPLIDFYTYSNVFIGKYCQIGPDVKIKFLPEHPLDRATTYPFPIVHDLWPNAKPYSRDFCSMRTNVYIGNEVWIGNGVTILGGTHIGDGAVIGANSVVRGHIPPYSICHGNRASIKKYRYSSEMIEAFLRIKWWEWTDEKVHEHVLDLCGKPEDFIKKFDPQYKES